MAGLLALASIASAETPVRNADTGLEEVLVTGEHPGPGLWKVSKGEHVLWILGTHSPLPQRLLWRSEEVEFVMTEAQQVIGNYSATFTFQGANPLQTKGKSLRSLLKYKDYAEWQKLKKLYIGPNKEIDSALPVTAALVLRSSAFERAGLISGDSVWREIYKLANTYHVPVTTQHQVNRTLSSIAPDDRDAERRGVAYLVNTMASLETDLTNARVRANAWAIGNVDALRKQAEADRTAADLYANSWPFFSAEEMRDLSKDTDARWLDAAKRALDKNTTTLAALPIFLILKPDGLMAQLESQGFEVEAPTK